MRRLIVYALSDARRRLALLLLIAFLAVGPMAGVRATYSCNRTPEGHGAMQTPSNGQFHVRILDNAAKYTPGQTYTISLEGIDRIRTPKPIRHKFAGFMLVVENKNADLNAPSIDTFQPMPFGTFELQPNNVLAKITCPNMITHTTTTPKSEVQVLWQAPPTGSGCVVFRATVIEHRDIWYMDDGTLSKEFCEEDQIIDETLSGINDPCCACSEAKYELTFEGLWSRNTHPKDFPSNNWKTRLSDIIGATHTVDYRIFQYGGTASAGLKQVAEFGATKELESELKGESEHIRTIIKARGLNGPNVTGQTYAVFRVDPLHHLVSFVSMVNPSPDWFLGVSGLELCLANCSWAESKVIDLYPWDAGTDSGSTYNSPDQPTNPQDNIRRIRSDQPNDPRSPFFDRDGKQMMPLARLYLLRQRLYEKNCPEAEENGNAAAEAGGSPDADGGDGAQPPTNPKPCATTPWSRFSRCSADCGTGTRTKQRSFLDEAAAADANCRQKLTQREDCVGKQAHCAAEEAAAGAEAADPDEPVTEAQCALTAWTEWSECLPKCGNGTRTRRRKYVEKRAKKKCEGGDYHPVLVQDEVCENPPCVGDVSPSEEEQQENDNRSDNEEPEDGSDSRPNDCLGDWTHWTSCSATCGGGLRMRYRRRKNSQQCEDEPEQEESKLCNATPCPVPNYCRQDPVGGGCRKRNATNMFFFNRNETRCDVFTHTCGRHRNRFRTAEECLTTCTGKSLQLLEKEADEEAAEEAERLEREERKNRMRNRGRNNGR